MHRFLELELLEFGSNGYEPVFGVGLNFIQIGIRWFSNIQIGIIFIRPYLPSLYLLLHFFFFYIHCNCIISSIIKKIALLSFIILPPVHSFASPSQKF